MMLELNNYYIQELENLTDLFTNIFVIIDDIYNEIIPIGIRNRRNIKDSKLSDSEIITISIVGELLTIDSEKSFFNLIDCQYKCNTLCLCYNEDLCRCFISKCGLTTYPFIFIKPCYSTITSSFIYNCSFKLCKAP